MKFKKTLVAFVTGILLFSFPGGRKSVAAEPPAKNPPASSDDFNLISKEIQQTVAALGYAGEVDIYLVQMLSGWKYSEWTKKLRDAKTDFQQKKIPPERLDQIRQEVLKELSGAIRQEFTPAAADSDYFSLTKIVADKTAQDLGYGQLLYILGNAIGLPVKVIDVLEPAAGTLPPGEEHAACLVELADGRAMIADLAADAFSKPFVFAEQYAAAGNYQVVKHKDNPLSLPRRIQPLDRNGLLGLIYYNLGNSYAKTKKDADALALYNKAIQLNPKLAKAYSSRAVILIGKNQQTQALADLEKAIQLDPRDAEAYCNLGAVEIVMKQNAAALANFTKAVELKPDFAGAYKYRGSLYSRSGKSEEAIADFAKAAQLNPKDAEVHFYLAGLYSQAGQFAKVISCCTKAVEIDPKFAEAYNLRGVAYGRSGKYTDALSDFIQAGVINPKFAEAFFNRGLVYSELNEFNQALTYFTKAIDINPKYTEAYNNRGITYLKLQKYSEALADFKKVIQRNPNYAPAYLNRAIVYTYLKKPDEAKKDLEKAAQLDPSLKDQIKKVSDLSKTIQ